MKLKPEPIIKLTATSIVIEMNASAWLELIKLTTRYIHTKDKPDEFAMTTPECELLAYFALVTLESFFSEGFHLEKTDKTFNPSSGNSGSSPVDNPCDSNRSAFDEMGNMVEHPIDKADDVYTERYYFVDTRFKECYGSDMDKVPPMPIPFLKQ